LIDSFPYPSLPEYAEVDTRYPASSCTYFHR